MKTQNNRDTATTVAIKHIFIHPGEKVLILNAGEGTLALALMERYPEGEFLLHESDIGESNLLLRRLQSSPTFNNSHLPIENNIENIQTIEKAFDVIIYQLGKYTSLELILSQFFATKQILKESGSFYLVTHTRSGAARHQKMLEEVFGEDVEVIGKGGGGYRIIEAINRLDDQTRTDTTIRQTIHFEILGQVFILESEPSLFSKNNIDIGTRVLLENVDLTSFDRMLDIGCGWGVIGIVAAVMNNQGHVVLTDINSRAVAVASDNVQHLTLEERVTLVATDDVSSIEGVFDLILSNPPFHEDTEALIDLFGAASKKLRENHSIYIVVERSYLSKFTKILEQTFGNVSIYHEDLNVHFVILTSRK